MSLGRARYGLRSAGAELTGWGRAVGGWRSVSAPGDRAADGAHLRNPGGRSESGGRGCEVAREPAAQKLTPSLDDLRAKLGDEATEFVVSMKAEVSPSDYPLPSGGRDAPDTWKRDERYLARASKLAEEQACAVAELRARGGTYLESFLLVNAFRAQMKPEQAAELSQRADVKLVELSQTDAPPPF